MYFWSYIKNLSISMVLPLLISCTNGSNKKHVLETDTINIFNKPDLTFSLQKDVFSQKFKLIQAGKETWYFELSLLNNENKKKLMISGILNCTYIDDITEISEDGYTSKPYGCITVQNGIEYIFNIKEGKHGFTEAKVSAFDPVSGKELEIFLKETMKKE